MKKLMFVTALAAAFAAAAEGIESNNTVGYQDMTVGSFNLTLTTFTSMSEGATLGDIKPNANFIAAPGTIQTFTAGGAAGPVYIYVNDAEMLEVFEAEEGWYLVSDDELTDCKNTVSLPFTTGFLAKSSKAGSALTYSGEVKATAAEIPIGSFTLTGNCSPADITLASITPNSTFISAPGTLQTFTAGGEAGPVYIYVDDAEMLEVFEAQEGWYLVSDDELTDCKNATTITSGSGFLSKASKNGATLSIPSAL